MKMQSIRSHIYVLIFDTPNKVCAAERYRGECTCEIVGGVLDLG